MKNKFRIIGIALLVIEAVFVIFAFAHPELSFPWHKGATYVLIVLYAILIVACFVMSTKNGVNLLDLASLVLTMAALFFYICMFLEYAVNDRLGWYLPVALGLNAAAFALTAYIRKIRKK